MATITIHNVSDEDRDRLVQKAREQHRSLNDHLVRQLRETARTPSMDLTASTDRTPSMEEWFARAPRLPITADEAIEALREVRDHP